MRGREGEKEGREGRGDEGRGKERGLETEDEKGVFR